MRLVLLVSWLSAAISMSAPAQVAGAQRDRNASDTVAIVRAVLDHIRPDFPHDSVVIDPHAASGRRLPVDSLAASIGARLGAEEDVVPCRGQTPDTCHLEAHLLVRIDSVFVGPRTAEVFVHLWKRGVSTLMPVAQEWRRFYVENRNSRWRFARADRRIQVTESVSGLRRRCAPGHFREEASGALDCTGRCTCS
jgi:hypothetical protein